MLPFSPTDVDECAEGTDNCQQVCTNTHGSFRCSCNTGLSLQSDGHSCQCGSRFTAASGSFQTPHWPSRYPQQDFQCEWIIQLSTDEATIEFTIDQSDYGINGRPPCSDDHIEFFDGTARNSASLEKICGSRSMYENHFPPAITTSSSEARVLFTGSQNSNRPSSRVGVKVDYRAILPQPTTSPPTTLTTATSPTTENSPSPTIDGPTVIVCGGRLTGSSGSIETPGWPDGYPQSSFQCEWTLDIAAPGFAIEFTIDESDYGIDGRSPCDNTDSIQFFDGLDASASLLYKLCGFMNPGPITTTSSQAFIIFSSSGNENRPTSRVGIRVDYAIQDLGRFQGNKHALKVCLIGISNANSQEKNELSQVGLKSIKLCSLNGYLPLR